MSDKENITAQDVVEKMMKDITLKADGSKVYGKSPLAQFKYKDDKMSERHKDLLERFPSKDIGDIKKLEKTLDTFDSSDIDMEEISELCLENDIVSSEILLLDVIFGNDLKTASRNGITILNIDGSLEIRNGEEKFLSPQETDLIKAYIVGEEDDLPPGIQSGVDPATPSDYSFGSMNTKTKQGVQEDVEVTSAEINYSQNEKVKLKGVVNERY